MIQHKVLYTAFDVHPSAKGASTHISHFTEAIFEHFDSGLLYILANEKLETYEKVSNVEIVRLKADIPNYIERAEVYSLKLFEILEEQNELQVCHFRDIWGGLPIVLEKEKKKYKTIFEVNGLPSIELPYRYPFLTDKTLEKFRKREMVCLEGADQVIVPSAVIMQHLIGRGVSKDKIKVISNGATQPSTSDKTDTQERYIIYFGALQSWQGIENLLKAFALIRDFSDIKLIICASTKAKKNKEVIRFAKRLGLEDSVVWHYRLDKKTLHDLVMGALFSVAPLKACDRNLEQGCSPLKILESMALGVPVLASDLPVVREIISDPSLGKLVRANRPAELARGMRLMIDNPAFTKEMGEKAKIHISENFLWSQKIGELLEVYDSLIKTL